MTGAPIGFRHPTAIVGGAPESRAHVADPALWHEPLVADTAYLGAYARVDAGTERPTTVGDRSWVFAGAHVGHDCLIGAGCEIGTNSVLCGFVVVGDDVRLGVGCFVRPYVKIGRGARLGCGAVVVRDVPAGETWAGNPARRIA